MKTNFVFSPAIFPVLFLLIFSGLLSGCASSISIPKKISENAEQSMWIYVEEASAGSTFKEKTLYYCEYKSERKPVCYEVKVEKSK
ncbi:MAG TPA: hypothetical protein PLZ43_14990 [bacterium]|nr:hypothetical protein [bacterium]